MHSLCLWCALGKDIGIRRPCLHAIWSSSHSFVPSFPHTLIRLPHPLVHSLFYFHPTTSLFQNSRGYHSPSNLSMGYHIAFTNLKYFIYLVQVNGTSLLGATHLEAVRALRSMGDKITLLVCDGYDPSKVPEVLPGTMPVMSLNAGRSVSEESIDRDPPTHERAHEEIRREIRRQVSRCFWFKEKKLWWSLVKRRWRFDAWWTKKKKNTHLSSILHRFYYAFTTVLFLIGI